MNQKDFIVKCPHCNGHVMIQEINCAIFRHGVFRAVRILNANL